jgi:hypothetical protein
MTHRSFRTRRGWTWLLAVVVGALAVAGPSIVAAETAQSAARSSCTEPSGSVRLGVAFVAGPGAAERAALDGYQAGIDALDRAGGLAGCHVELVPFRIDPATDAEQQAVRACDSFVRRPRVLAVFSAAEPGEAAARCYADAGMPVFPAGDASSSSCDGGRRAGESDYEPAGVAVCRFGSFIGVWERAGLFRDGAQVGIVVVDDEAGANRALAEQRWGPALRRRNIAYQTMVVPAATSAGGFSDALTTISAGLGRFMTDGVNVVLFTPSGGLAPAGFLPTAASRDYVPAYGLTSADDLARLGTIGAAAVRTALAISWRSGDLPLAAQQALPPNSAVARCAQWAAPSETTIAGASAYCDFVNILLRTLGRADHANAAALRKRIDALGTTFVSSLTYGGATKLGPRRHDGAHVAQVVEFDVQTKTFRPRPGAKTATIP